MSYPGEVNAMAFNYVLPSTSDAVRSTLKTLRSDLAEKGCHPCPTSMWELVLAEVLNNIVEHAYENRESGEIRFGASIKNGMLSAGFIDSGREMPDGTLPSGSPANVDVETASLPEGGFGWFLIQSLSENLVYERRGAENHLRLDISLQTGGEPEAAAATHAAGTDAMQATTNT